MPRLTYKDEAGQERQHPLGEKVLAIGRSPECDVTLSDPEVARLHAIVELREGKLTVADQGSTGGTFVNGEKVEGSLELSPGDEVRIGTVSFRVEEGEPEAASAATTRRRSRSTRPTRREVLGGVKLSGRQQLLVKLACAVIMLTCVILGVHILSRLWGKQPAPTRHVIYVDPLSKPRRLAREAKSLWREANGERSSGNTDRAFELVTRAKDSIEKAQEEWGKLGERYQSEGYAHIHREAAETNTIAVGIRNDWLRMKMQLEREGGG
jgi:pSer/pThr/pTyr-binding forkhead associated (FHA) protein